MSNLNIHIKSLGLFFCLSVFLFLGCLEIKSQNHIADALNDVEDVLEIELNTKKTFQTIKNFGASDAWSTQFVGRFWSDDVKDKIATLLFSSLNKSDGSPEGIGLTAWRFNIGAGSAEQNASSLINDEWRRTESFLIDDNQTYNWNKQSGQLWFLKEAKKRGVNTFIGFVNSPPVFYTKNGKAFSNNGLSSNLQVENYKKFANFLTEVVKGVESKTGVVFDYISPFNEPQWKWECCKQEGTPWNNDEIFNAVKEIDIAFKNSNIPSKIEITEAAKINYLYTQEGMPSRGKQTDYFFNKKSASYVGNLNSISKKIVGHSYFSTWNIDILIDSREALNNEIKSLGTSLEYWMTEYCILEDNKLIKGNGRDLGINPALYLARVIHSDLVFANASAWHWWLAISPYNYKDGLIYIDKNKYGGNYYDSKMLWALGHFSRFIKPEMKRISISRLDNKTAKQTITGLVQSAYMSDDEIVIVFVNQLNQNKKVKIFGIPEGYKSMEVYQTTNVKNINLKKVESLNVNQTFNIPEKSLMTCVLRKKHSI